MDLLYDIVKFFTLASIGILTAIGAISQAFDGLSGWLADRFKSHKNTRSPAKRIMAFIVCALWTWGAGLLAVDLWIGIHKVNPVKIDAAGLADEIESAMQRGEQSDQIQDDYGEDVVRIAAKVLRKSQGKQEKDALRQTLNRSDITLDYYTNFVKNLRAAAGTMTNKAWNHRHLPRGFKEAHSPLCQ